MVWNFILYLLYGLTFFTLGVAILSRDIRLSELAIARIIWLLAAFGIVHGFHEWLELLEQLFPQVISPPFSLFRLVVVSLSFLFLLYFGIFLNIITLRGEQGLQTTPRWIKALIGAAALLLILVAAYVDSGNGNDNKTRLLVAFPGGLFAGIGLVLYSRTVHRLSRKAGQNLAIAGIFMVVYAICTGLIPSQAVVPLLETKIIVLRSLSGFLIMVFTIKALSVFSVEQRELVHEQLRRFSHSEKLTSMGILAAGIAHEINNPLTNVSLNVEMLKDLVGHDARAARKIAAIERNLIRATRIAGELLHFSQERETELLTTDLNQIITSAINLLRSQPQAGSIRLDLGSIPKIKGIPWKLEEVFLNLLLNSLDACGPEGEVTVKTFCNNRQVMAILSDTGCGIRAEHLDKVFDPFFTTKGVGKGTGLGLSVSYNIIKQHGATITLTSEEGLGTVATLIFPQEAHDR